MRLNALSVAAIGLAILVLAVSTMSSAYSQEPPIYGSQLMTEQERAEYRARMRAATSEEERDQIRLEHHARMQQRAEERGFTLPDAPPVRRGMRQGGGQGGKGQGMDVGRGGMMRQGAGTGRRGN